MQYLHVVARAREGCRPLSMPLRAWSLWARLRAAFPDALAACLMPNHVHLIVKGESPGTAKRKLALAVRGLSRAAGTGGLWEPVPPPAVIPDHKHLLRQIRYVHLNPCRDGLTPDPLCWPWSTHRGLAGAEYKPWVNTRLLARELSLPHTGFVEWIHA